MKASFAYIIEISLHDMNIAGQSLQIIVRLFGAQVARTKNVLDAIWNENLFEFGRQIVASVGNVQVAEYEDELIYKIKDKIRSIFSKN